MAQELKHGTSGYEPDFVLQRDVDEAKLREDKERQQREAELDRLWASTHQDIVTEENWAQLAAMGLRPIADLPLTGDEETDKLNLGVAKESYGHQNVYTGHAYDEEAERPLAGKPGGSIYTNEAGEEHYAHILPQIQEGPSV